MTNSWIYQGRQYHGLFGHGKGPAKDPPDPTTALTQRIHDIGHTLVAGLPHGMRRHDAARLGPEDHARLDRVLTAVVDALPSGLPTMAQRVFGRSLNSPGLADIGRAAALLRDGRDNANLRAATDALGQAAVDIGLDRFKDFLRRADEHISAQDGLLTFVRNLPAPPTVAPPSPVISRLPPLGALGPFLSVLFRRAGWLVLAGAAVGALLQSHHEAQVRDAIERFRLDPANASDMAAALAYVWARVNRSLLLGTALPYSAQDAVAEEVMRAVRTDPTLLDRAMDADRTALDAIRAAVRRVPALGPRLGVGLITNPADPDEQALVNSLRDQGKSGSEIQMALDNHRRKKMGITTKQLRRSPGDVFVSVELPNADRSWIVKALERPDGAPIPGQVAAKLVGRNFSSFDALRAAIWNTIGDIPELSEAFDELSLLHIRNANAPYPSDEEQVIVKRTGQLSYRPWEIHHDPGIGEGGAVYDLGTMRIVTPKQHDALTKKASRNE